MQCATTYVPVFPERIFDEMESLDVPKSESKARGLVQKGVSKKL
jgi:hypothetical protein